MEYHKFQPVPVLSSDGIPLMPCHPARARKLLDKGRAKPHHYRGIFAIKLTDRTRDQSEVQNISLNIDPGSDTSGFAAVTDNEDGQRTVLTAVELKHQAKATKKTLHDRASKRQARRHRLRHRTPRFDNRRKPKGWLPPSIQTLRQDTLRVVNTLRKLMPVSSISIEANKFDTQLMMDPDIKGKEYQRGTVVKMVDFSYILTSATPEGAVIAAPPPQQCKAAPPGILTREHRSDPSSGRSPNRIGSAYTPPQPVLRCKRRSQLPRNCTPVRPHVLHTLPCRYGEGDLDAIADGTHPSAGDTLGTAEQATGQHQRRSLVYAEPVTLHELHPAYHAGKGRVDLLYLHSLPVSTGQEACLDLPVAER